MGHMNIFVNVDCTWVAFKKSWRYVILTKLGQHVNEMMAVGVNFLKNFFIVQFSYNQTKC